MMLGTMPLHCSIAHAFVLLTHCLDRSLPSPFRFYSPAKKRTVNEARSLKAQSSMRDLASERTLVDLTYSLHSSSLTEALTLSNLRGFKVQVVNRIGWLVETQSLCNDCHNDSYWLIFNIRYLAYISGRFTIIIEFHCRVLQRHAAPARQIHMPCIRLLVSFA